MSVQDFFEDDEAPADVWARFDEGDQGVTGQRALPSSLFLKAGNSGSGRVEAHQRQVDVPHLRLVPSTAATANRSA